MAFFFFGGICGEESERSSDPFLLRHKDTKVQLKNFGGLRCGHVTRWGPETKKVKVTKLGIPTPKLLVMSWEVLEKNLLS